MANRYSSAVLFAMEKNLTLLYAHITFGAAGAPTLDTQNSKGFCNVSQKLITFTGTTSGASPTVTSVSSFVGLYPGMTVQDSGPTHVNQLITSMNAGASTITLAGNATGTNTGLTAFGGQYVLQLGYNAGVNLDSYFKFLSVNYSWDESASQGGVSTLALAPNAPDAFIVGNNTRIRTVPATATSGATDCTLTFQLGAGSGTSFVAAVPNSGDGLRITMVMGNCSAP